MRIIAWTAAMNESPYEHFDEVVPGLRVYVNDEPQLSMKMIQSGHTPTELERWKQIRQRMIEQRGRTEEILMWCNLEINKLEGY